MKLSKAQSVSLDIMQGGVVVGLVAGLPLIMVIALLADLHTVASLICLLFVPVITACVGAMVGAVLFIVSTIIRVLLSK